jgi:polyphosphate kinase
VFVASADWMPRNFFRRIETAFPIEDGNLRERVIREFLSIPLADTVKARELQADGTYIRGTTRSRSPRRSQWEFMALAGDQNETVPGPKRGRAPYPKVKLAPRPAALGAKLPRSRR